MYVWCMHACMHERDMHAMLWRRPPPLPSQDLCISPVTGIGISVLYVKVWIQTGTGTGVGVIKGGGDKIPGLEVRV